METPGCWQMATSSALNSGECTRRRRRVGSETILLVPTCPLHSLMDSYALTKTDRPQCVFTGWIQMGHSARGDAASVRIAGLRIERSFMLSSLDSSFLVLEHVQIGILDQLGWRHAQMRHDLVRFSDASGLGLTVLQHHFKFQKFT